MPSALSFPAEDIDHVLRLGCGTAEHRMEIAAGYMAGKSMDEIVNLLKSKYRGGTGLLTDSGRLSVWFGEDGIRISEGDRARYAEQFQLVSWEDAAGRIGELLDAGRFASNVELAEAPGHFRARLAESMDDGSATVRRGGDSRDNLSHDDERPSVLNDLKEKAGQVVSITRDARPRKEVIL